MARGVDFMRLYHEFGLQPGANIDDLKLAYRRRVSVLHPDRMDGDDRISQHLANEHLGRLTSLYEAAVRFHRQHGRLPGATTAPRGDRVEAPARFNPAAADEPVPAPRRLQVLAWASPLLAIALIAWLVYALDTTDHAVAPAGMDAPAATVAADRVRKPSETSGQGIYVGLDAIAIVRMLGEPMTREGSRWDYGPSWVRFEDGKVAEWYSSPLHRLRIGKAPPAARPQETSQPPAQ